MNLPFHLLAPLLVVLPAANAIELPRESQRGDEVALRVVAPAGPVSRPLAEDILPFQGSAASQDAAFPQQVSIERRVTIRIAPRAAPPPMPVAMFAQDSVLEGPRFAERKAGKCLPIGAIAGVQPVSTRKLLLTMRDNRMFTAELEKGCQARDYYSGFLVAQSGDGMICKDRDKLRARSGATCEVSGFRQIVTLTD